MSTVQTTLTKHSPFPGKAPRPKAVYQDLPVESVQRCRDPYTPERVVLHHKWDAMFAGLQEGDCFKLRAGGVKELSALARALREYMRRHGLDGLVRQSMRTADGVGRVWCLKLWAAKKGKQND